MLYYTDIKKILGYANIAFIFLIAGGASDFSNSKELLTGGWLFFTIVYLYYEKHIRPKFILLATIFIGISLLYFFRNDAYNYVTYLGFFMKVYVAFYCRSLCKEYFSEYLIKTVYVLTCISLVMYTLQLAAFDTMYNLINWFGADGGTVSEANCIVFTMVPIHVIRNCGFMWEPGAFVSILMLVYYLNVFHKHEPLTSRKNIVFVIAILTTQSTMGILALLIPFSIKLKEFIMQDRLYQRLAVVVVPSVLLILGIVFSQVDFLYKKMVAEIANLEEEFIEMEKGARDDYIVSLTRTASVIVDWRAIKEYPLLGLGVDMRTVSFDKLGVHEKLETACGTTILIQRFGFIGFFLYIYLLYRYALFDTALHKIGWVLIVNYILFTQEFSASSFFHLFVF
jgi:hypothetical protein